MSAKQPTPSSDGNPINQVNAKEEDYKKEVQESTNEEYILNMRKLLISQKFFNQFKSILSS